MSQDGFYYTVEEEDVCWVRRWLQSVLVVHNKQRNIADVK